MAKNQRKNSKYPNLNTVYNTKRRRYIIETEGINGIYDPETKEELLRPWTEEEKAFYNKFLGEYNNATFDSDPEKNLHKMSLEDVLKLIELNVELGVMDKSSGMIIRQIPSKVKKKMEKFYSLRKNKIMDLIKNLDYRTQCYNANNSRNRDLYTLVHATGRMKTGLNVDNISSESYEDLVIKHTYTYYDEASETLSEKGSEDSDTCSDYSQDGPEEL